MDVRGFGRLPQLKAHNKFQIFVMIHQCECAFVLADGHDDYTLTLNLYTHSLQQTSYFTFDPKSAQMTWNHAVCTLRLNDLSPMWVRLFTRVDELRYVKTKTKTD